MPHLTVIGAGPRPPAPPVGQARCGAGGALGSPALHLSGSDGGTRSCNKSRQALVQRVRPTAGGMAAMSGRRTAVVVLVAVALAACSAAPATQPTSVAEITRPPITATPAVTPKPEPPTEPPTHAATPKPTPSPTAKPTSTPVPPKPSGLDFGYCCGLGGDGVSSLAWDKPRTKGVEIRVYGVTTCFPARDRSVDTCLREHVTLPDGIGVLLAKGPASTGGLSWQQGEGDDDRCAYEYLSKDGTSFYSVVVAAYNATDHSAFAIADRGYYDTEACAPYVIQKGDTLRRIASSLNVTVDDLTAANKSTLPDPNRLQVGATILIPQPAP
jgi:hypothetical protein